MTPTENAAEPTLRDLYQLIRRGILPALLVAVAAAVATYFLSERLDPVYEARASVLASQVGTDLEQFGASLATAPVVDVAAYDTAVLSAPVVGRALEQLGTFSPGLREIGALRDATSIRTEERRFSALLHIDVESGSAERAAAAANALAESLLAWDRQRATSALERIGATLESQLSALDEQIRSQQVGGAVESELTALFALREERRQQLLMAQTLELGAVGLLEIVEPALPPLEPVAPNPTRNAALALVLGVFLTYGVLLLRDALDTRVRSSDDLARLTGQPVLAEFPKMSGGQRRLPREAVRYLRTNLLFATADAHPKVILVSSAGSEEGKSSVALSLAEGFARNDHRTLLVDADLRKPVIAETFGIDRRSGSLANHLNDPHLPLNPVRLDIEGHEPLHVVPTFGTPHAPTELLGRGMRTFLERARSEYDVIVVDSAPLLPVADSLTIAPHVTGTVLVVSMQDADRRRVVSAQRLLERMGVRLLGVVSTRMNRSGAYGSDGYGYGYGYGYGGDEGGGTNGRRGGDAAPQVASGVRSVRPSK